MITDNNPADTSRNEDRLILIYTTIGNVSDAETLGEPLVARGLAACINIFPGIQSIYELDGKLEFDHEAAMIIKTRAALKTRLMEEASQLHPYETPALIQLRTEDCNASFQQWVRTHTSQRGRGVN